MKKLRSIFIVAIVISNNSYCQNLTLTELLNIANQPNWEHINQTLHSKGWEYHGSAKGNYYSFSTITWSLNRNTYGDKATAWFYCYTVDEKPEKIIYNVVNKVDYDKVMSTIKSNGFIVVKNEILDGSIMSKYSNNKFVLTITTENRKDETWGNSLTSYNFELIKKTGSYDPENGWKTEYFPGSNQIEEKYYLLNGEINGRVEKYWENGSLKFEAYFKNGIINGECKLYDEQQRLIQNYSMLNGKMNGKYTEYKYIENERKVIVDCNYSNGEIHGNYKLYEYDENENLRFFLFGKYVNGNKEGDWKRLDSEESGEILESWVFSNDLKNGKCVEYIDKDTLEINHYIKGIKNGYHEKSGKAKGKYKDNNKTVWFWILLEKGDYKDDQKNGHWEYFDITLKKVEEGSYLNGNKIGEWKSFVTVGNNIGQIKTTTNYLDGIKEGEYKNYFKHEVVNTSIDEPEGFTFHNTRIIETYNYHNGKAEGPYLLTDSTGKLEKKGNFKNDKMEGTWYTYYGNQNKYTEEDYENDILIERRVFYDNVMYYKEKYKNERIFYLLLNYNDLRIEHFINYELNGIVINEFNYRPTGDSIIITTSTLPQTDMYTFENFLEKSQKHGDYTVAIGDKKVVTGQYFEDRKTGYWITEYNKINVYVTRGYKNGILESELWYDSETKKLKNGSIKIIYQGYPMVLKLKKGKKHGKCILYLNDNKTILETHLYKNGIEVQ